MADPMRAQRFNVVDDDVRHLPEGVTHKLRADLIEYLRGKEIGENVTDEQLEAVIGMKTAPKLIGNKYSKGYSHLLWVTHWLSHHGEFWRRESGAGFIRRVTHDEWFDYTIRQRGNLGRRSRRILKSVQTIPTESLTPERRLKIAAHAALLGVQSMAGQNKSAKALEARTVRPPDLRTLLASLTGERNEK